MAYDQLKLGSQMCFRLYTAARLVTNAYTPWFKQLGITYPQYLVLMILWENDNRVIGEITELLGLETNTVTPLLQRMEKQGLVIRSKGLVDSRQRIISLTREGKKLEEQAKEIPACLLAQLAQKGIHTEELAALAPMLDLLIDAMKEAAPSAPERQRRNGVV